MKKGSKLIVALILILSSCTDNKKPVDTDQHNTAKETATVTKKKTIVFFGNSLTAGYGLSPEQAFLHSFKKR
jgi:acyl-CoA thioesterase-1